MACQVDAKSKKLVDLMLERLDSKVSKPYLMIGDWQQSHGSNQSSQWKEHAPE